MDIQLFKTVEDGKNVYETLPTKIKSEFDDIYDKIIQLYGLTPKQSSALVKDPTEIFMFFGILQQKLEIVTNEQQNSKLKNIIRVENL